MKQNNEIGLESFKLKTQAETLFFAFIPESKN